MAESDRNARLRELTHSARPPRDLRFNARISALIELLRDESPRVWKTVRRELDTAGSRALPMLLRAAKNPDPALRARSRSLLLDQERRRVVGRLLATATRPRIDLERAMILLGRLEDPRLDARPYFKALDAMASEVSKRIAGRPPGIEHAHVLAHYLGKELGYSGESSDYYNPDNIFLHRAIERRRGLPLTLSTIYLCVARRVRIPAAVVPLPGHVMLRMYGGSHSLMVDPFQGGVVRTEQECLHYLAQHGLAFQASWFRDAEDSSMFLRQILNLRNGYQRRNRNREVRRLNVLLRAFELRVAGRTMEKSAKVGRSKS